MASVNIVQPCSDASDIVPLYPQHGLYLKPIAKLNISVHLPTLKLPGKAISNWEVMEKLKYWTIPDEFTSIVVSKTTLEFIRFEAEIESRSKLAAVLARLDGRFIKISGFTESLKVRAAEAKCDFPTRHNWDSFFRDAKNMNEMKPGERPDTIHIKNLPCKWFSSKSLADKPSEYILRKVFETFGEVRCVDIPSLDPYRSRMKAHISGIKMFTYHQNAVFEGYIQFKEYVCFVKAMDTLRGMKLIYKEDSKIFSANVTVDFDKTKHLGDTLVRKRRNEREKLMAEERAREEEERLKKEKEEADIEAERKRKLKEKEDKLKRRQMREGKRKLKQLEKLKSQEAEDMNRKIASEERLLLMAQRRLESIRLLSELFKRVEEATLKKLAERKQLDKHCKKEKLKWKQAGKPYNLKLFNKEEEELRRKLIEKLKKNDVKKSKNKPGSSRTTNAIVSICDAPPQSSSHEDVASLITSSESDLSVDELNDGSKSKKGKTQPLPDKFFNNRRRGTPWFPHGGDIGQSYNHYASSKAGFNYHMQRGGYFPRGRRGYRWPYHPGMRGRGCGRYFPPPYIDPLMLDINHQYYKYFHKLTHGKSSRSPSRNSRSYSRSRSRSSSRSSYYSRRRSRSRSYSKTRRSRSYSRSRSRSRRHSDRSSSSRSSRSRSQRKSKSSKGTKSRSSRRSRSMSGDRHRSQTPQSSSKSRFDSKLKHDGKDSNQNRSRSKSRSNSRSGSDKPKRKTRWDSVDSSSFKTKNKDGNTVGSENKTETKQPETDSINSTKTVDVVCADENPGRKSPIRFPSPGHTWSRTPSRTRSLSWETKGEKSDKEKKDEDGKSKVKNSTKHHKEKKHKKKKKHKSR